MLSLGINIKRLMDLRDKILKWRMINIECELPEV